jgi:hypothetical protein
VTENKGQRESSPLPPSAIEKVLSWALKGGLAPVNHFFQAKLGFYQGVQHLERKVTSLPPA